MIFVIPSRAALTENLREEGKRTAKLDLGVLLGTYVGVCTSGDSRAGRDSVYPEEMVN